MSEELLQAHIDNLHIRMEDMERLTAERLRHIRDDIDKTFESHAMALAKAEAAADTRFESVNEFRRTLSDQSQEFLRNATYNTAHTALMEKTDDLNNRVTSMDAIARNTAKPVSGPAFLIGLSSVAVAIVIAVVTGGIQMGSLQTHVEVNSGLIHQLQIFERESSKSNAQQDADIGLLKSRQSIAEHRLEKTEDTVEKNSRMRPANP